MKELVSWGTPCAVCDGMSDLKLIRVMVRLGTATNLEARRLAGCDTLTKPCSTSSGPSRAANGADAEARSIRTMSGQRAWAADHALTCD